MRWRSRIAALAVVGGILGAGLVEAAKISDVRGTKHNLSASTTYVRNGATLNVPARNIKAAAGGETEVCIFCHTPHGTQTGNVTALWNRNLSSTVYSASNTFTSSSMDADATELAGGPGGSSKLCLSCHDGTAGIDKVNVNMTGGTNTQTINMVDGSGTALTSPVYMPAGAGEDSGFTRRLGSNMSNDHPISFTYSATVVSNDGELNTPAAENTVGGIVMNRAGGKEKPVLPLEAGKMQCSTCHDPHLRDENDANAKFLRQNRYQTAAPVAAGFRVDTDIICLACHNKGNASWAFSAHAHDQVATPTYQATSAAALRGFAGKKVWEVACLNCHDTHTAQGSRRLLREGVTTLAANADPVTTVQTGVAGGSKTTNDFSKSAIENTCYQCHDGSGAIINATGNSSGVPNIKAEFAVAGIKMPISLANEDAKHDIASNITGTLLFPETVNCGTDKKCGADFMESRANLSTRHAECTDCHNPHRVMKVQNAFPASLTSANTKEKAGTHKHEDATGYTHSNIISGVLRGSWGVEPDYTTRFDSGKTTTSFQNMPTGFTVKRGDPAGNTVTTVGQPYVTREYQICLKCHSNYGYEDDNVYPNGAKRPLLGGTGLTAQNANGHTNFSRYTNQAKEFQAPLSHAKQVGSVSLGFDGGAGTSATVTATNDNNHRSWHPVIAPTGRTSRPAAGFRLPWSNALGTQTMYCSDCHGSATGSGTVMPTGNTNGTTSADENGAPWGPHGSTLNFLLKGDYNTNSGAATISSTLCFKCHNSSRYAGSSGGTGFNIGSVSGFSDGHALHNNKIKVNNNPDNIRCNWCHVGVPHGWKNRGFLVNLNDVGPEGGNATPGPVTFTNNTGYSNGPYYRKAFLKIRSFPTGNWGLTNCQGGDKNSMINNCGTPN